MHFSKIFLLVFCGWIGTASASLLEIPASDGLTITADTYFQTRGTTPPIIVLFHQARASRGEYQEIAPKLNALGYHCIAIDQRSGESINGIPNQTAALAKKQKKPAEYVDAIVDMEAALEYVHRQYPGAPVIAWGSSYSAALALNIAAEKPTLLDGVVAFSPGEYFSKQGKSGTWITDSAQYIRVPVFISSAQNEYSLWSSIYQNIPTTDKHAYLPSGEGAHGSRALWSSTEDEALYWGALENFLGKYFPPTSS